MAQALPLPISKTLSFRNNMLSHYPQRSSRFRGGRHIGCMTLEQTCVDQQTIVRRTANYQPPIWNHEIIQSLNSEYKGGFYEKQSDQLKEKVKTMLENLKDPLQILEFIDTMERLGVAYHFETEIESILENMYTDVDHKKAWSKAGNLHAMALEFRLLRQHGHMVPQDFLTGFKDKCGNFNESVINDIEGLLSLYEASFLLMGGEEILEEAMKFTTKHLQLHLNNKRRIDPYTAMLISHSLGVPLHWRMQRMESRRFIDIYQENPCQNATLLLFAKLDYNMLQAIHQEDLQSTSRWWEGIGWKEKLPFTRNRVMENYLWSLGEAFEPKYRAYRDFETRINIASTCLDDVYDIYGTLKELQLFTDAAKKWDVNELDKLPKYMRICYLGLFNLINELAYHTLKDHDINILPYLKEKWIDIFEYYMMEAKWASNSYIPTLEEYLNYSWISITAAELLTHAFFLSKLDPITNPITQEELDGIERYHDMIKWPSLIVRLADDLGTACHEAEFGDNAKSIEIYMHETGASVEEARNHVKHLIYETWKEINKARLSNGPFNRSYIEIATNIGRVSQFMYEHGDGHGQDIGGKNKERIILLLVEPIPLTPKDFLL